MFWDTHLHCNFSGDSSSRPQDMAEAAAARGLPGICFTDHLDYDYPPDPGLFLFDPAIYEKEIKKLFPDVTTYVTYNAPFWRLRVGDFRSHEEAYHMQRLLMDAFPAYKKEMYIVKEEVKIPLN